jgi:iron complex outermembrane receptor protein
VSAVILIVTRRGGASPFVSAGLEAGSYERFGQTLSFGGSSDEFGAYLFGRHLEEEGYRDNSHFRTENYTGKFDFEPAPGVDLDFSAGYHTVERELPGALTAEEMETVGRRGSVTPGDSSETDQSHAGLGIDFTPREAQKISTVLFLTHNDQRSLTSIPGVGSTSIDDDEDDFNAGVKYTDTRRLLARENRLIAGVDLFHEEIVSESFSNYPDPLFPFIQTDATRYRRKGFGIFLHDRYAWTARILVEGGLRFDRAFFHFSKTTEDLAAGTPPSRQRGSEDFDMFSPKGSIIFLLTEETSLYFTYARTFRYPNRDELTGFFGLTPALDPERGENFEAGVKAHYPSRFTGGVSLFHLTMKDEIVFRPPAVGDFAFGQNENFDEILHKGVEISAEMSIIPRVSFMGGYAYVETEIQEGPFAGRQLPITPRHSGSLGSRIDLAAGLVFWTEARFTGERFLANDLSNTFQKLPGYGVWDAKVSYKRHILAAEVLIFAGVHNLLDREYAEFGGVGGFPFGSRIGYNPSPERNYSGGIEVEWTF